MPKRNSPQWAAGSNQHIKRPRPVAPTTEPDLTLNTHDTIFSTYHGAQFAGLTWSRLDISTIPATSTERARYRFTQQLPELLWNTAKLEGNSYTLPEVRTLMDGVTIGGRPISDTQQILALKDAYEHLDNLVRTGTFQLSKDVSDSLHARLARYEALDAGMFRGEGSSRGGGHVRLSDGTTEPGIEHGEGGQALVALFDQVTAEIQAPHVDPREAALIYFAAATRAQFYFDGNKRTARLMMAGHLMSNGFEAVSIANSRRLELNQALDTLFARNDATPLFRLLATSSIASEPV